MTARLGDPSLFDVIAERFRQRRRRRQLDRAVRDGWAADMVGLVTDVDFTEWAELLRAVNEARADWEIADCLEPLDVRCETCGMPRGSRCYTSSGQPTAFHAPRRVRAGSSPGANFPLDAA